MARVSKGFDERLAEFLGTAQQLFMTKGYEQTSINDIIDQMGVAKGTFYHYFKSKEDLLEKLAEQFATQTLEKIRKVIQMDELNAVEKLNMYFSEIWNLKVENRDLMILFMKVMYSDKNLRYRYKMFKTSAQIIRPELNKIIDQGKAEGLLDPVSDKDTPTMIFSMGTYVSESLVDLLRDLEQKPGNAPKIEQMWTEYQKGIERLLGAADGSLTFAIGRDFSAFKLDAEEDKDE
jgi:AcrR family transcriptional regulator